MENVKYFLFNKFSVLLISFILNTISTIPTNYNLKLNREITSFNSILHNTESIAALIGSRNIELKALPNILPLNSIKITSKFGESRKIPYAYRHKGVDFAGKKGTRINTTADGTIMFAGKMYGYGKIVIIKHDYNIVTVYAHLNEIHTYTGKNVDKGEKIGELGSTGRSTGNHLHYEIRINNIPINPVRFTKLTKELTS